MKTRGWHREDGGWKARQRLDCGDLSPLSAGDSSPSSASAPRDKSPGPESCDESQHSKAWRLVAAVVRRRLTSPWHNAHRSVSRALTSAATLLALGIVLTTIGAHAQYSVDWFTLDGGGGTSTSGVYSVSGTLGQPDAGGPLTGGAFAVTGGFWALPIGVPTPGRPTLHIVPAALGFARISWSPATPGFVLQMSDKLTAPSWSDAPSGAANPATVPATLPSKFYRLRKP